MNGPEEVIKESMAKAKPIAEPFIMGLAGRTQGELREMYREENNIVGLGGVPDKDNNLMWAQAFELTGNEKAAELEYELLDR